MSVDGSPALRNRVAHTWQVTRSRLFGDRLGLVVFLASVVFLGLCWRIGFFLTDSHTVANLLANVADGRLEVTAAPYSLTATSQPGLVEVGGKLFGRNYGQVYLAVPIVWLLEGLMTLLDLRILLAGAWSLAIFALGRTAAAAFDRSVLAEAGAIGGAVAILIAILARSAIPDVQLHLVALQLTTILVAAAGATVLYRLLAMVENPRVGLVAGLALILATPLGFWGTLPKRHVYTATLLLLACFWFAMSRETDGRRGTMGRAGAYGAVGFLAAIHAFEAAFMLAALVPIDLATARAAAPRQHATVLLVFLLAISPMLATNVAVAGDPLQPPRQLPSASGGELAPDLGDEAGSPGGGDGSGSDGGTDGGGGDGSDGSSADGGDGTGPPGDDSSILTWFEPLAEVLATVGWIGGYMFDSLVAGVTRLGEPGRLYHVFVRSGWIPGLRYGVNGYETIELTLLESFPLAGALMGLPVLAVDRFRRTGLSLAGGTTQLRAVDALAGGMAVSFVLVYLPLLPLHSMVTLRYVAPAMALLLYGICRLAPVRAAIDAELTTFARWYAATVGLGGLALLSALPVVDPAVGEAFQLHAIVGLGTAVVAAVTVATWPVHRRPDVVATGLALAAGVTTLFLLAAALWHLQYGVYALDVARVVAETLPPIG